VHGGFAVLIDRIDVGAEVEQHLAAATISSSVPADSSPSPSAPTPAAQQGVQLSALARWIGIQLEQELHGGRPQFAPPAGTASNPCGEPASSRFALFEPYIDVRPCAASCRTSSSC